MDVVAAAPSRRLGVNIRVRLRGYRRVMVAGGALLGLLLAPLSAGGQQFGVDQIDQQFRDRPPIRSEPGLVIEPFDEAAIPKAAFDVRYRIASIEILGVTAFRADQLRPLYADLIGRVVSDADVQRLEGAIQNLYLDAGYPFFDISREGSDGSDPNAVRLVIAVTEAFIEDIVVRGELADPRGYFDYYKRQLTAERPISLATLERYTLLARDLPGFKSGTSLASSPRTPGGLILVFEIQNEPPLSGSVTLDNRGSDAIGPLQFDARVAGANLLDVYDRTELRFINAGFGKELLLFDASHAIPLHPEGTALLLNARHTLAFPGTRALRLLEFESRSTTGSFTFRHPFIRSRRVNLFGDLSFDFRESETELLGGLNSKDQIRSVRVAMAADRVIAGGSDPIGRPAADQIVLTVSQGLPIFGADNDNPRSSRADGRVDYTKATLFVRTDQNVGGRLDLEELRPLKVTVAGFAQLANGGLLSAEECSLGGVSFGRAYDSSQLTGDHCVAGSIELNYVVPIPQSKDHVAPYVFFDIGQVWNEGNAQSDGSLASAGLGIRFRVLDAFDGSLEVAKPLTRSTSTTTIDKDFRFFFSLSGEF